MSEFGSYSGVQLLAEEVKENEWLVKNYIREGDNVIFVGNEKSGKSLLILQLMFALTSKSDFFDEFNVTKECKVTYMQLEGKRSDTIDRMKRMHKTHDFHPENFHLMFLPNQTLHENKCRNEVLDEIRSYWKKFTNGATDRPDVMIIDPLYMAFTGSLNNDEIIRKFIGNIRIIKETLNCTFILVHHTHKSRWANDGKIIDEGDDAIFGSKFLQAYPDSVLLFQYDKKSKKRTLACKTQRSGDIVEKCVLNLVEPDPLYFELETAEHKDKKKDNTKRHKQDINLFNILTQHPEGVTYNELHTKHHLNKNDFYMDIKELIKKGVVVKSTDKRPVVYKVK